MKRYLIWNDVFYDNKCLNLRKIEVLYPIATKN